MHKTWVLVYKKKIKIQNFPIYLQNSNQNSLILMLKSKKAIKLLKYPQSYPT